MLDEVGQGVDDASDDEADAEADRCRFREPVGRQRARRDDEQQQVRHEGGREVALAVLKVRGAQGDGDADGQPPQQRRQHRPQSHTCGGGGRAHKATRPGHPDSV